MCIIKDSLDVICKTSIAKHKPQNVKLKFANKLDLSLLVARSRCPFSWPIPEDIVIQARVQLLKNGPGILIIVSYIRPVSRSRSAVPHPCPVS